ncbi:hypothetical protein [Paraburkholderia tropica]|uniref:hypothetical protein n=1 Tax=Paraburkholderia tropica TaxID=92647 RepID=UPI000942571C|nr:hypothetical protein [Paraburkholderia tropica]RQN38549.1 hypothetical protein EHZ25_12370 [Paraburkholderia tropica]
MADAPEDINPEYGGPERYFDEWIREEIHHARQALDAMKARWQAGEGAIEQLQEALMGLEIAAKGQGLLAQARLADAMTGG